MAGFVGSLLSGAAQTAGAGAIGATAAAGAGGLAYLFRDTIGTGVRGLTDPYLREVDTNINPALAGLLHAIRGTSPETAPPTSTGERAVRTHTLSAIPRRTLLQIRTQLRNTLAFEAGEGHPLREPLTDDEQATLRALIAALETVPDGDEETLIDFSAHRDVFQAGLRTAAQVIEKNSPQLARLLQSVYQTLSDASRTANPHCRWLRSDLNALLLNRAALSEEKRTEIKEHLRFIIAHPGLLEGSGTTIDPFTALLAHLETGIQELDYPLFQAAYEGTVRIEEHQSGEATRVVNQVRAALLDPQSGVLKEALEVTLGQGGLADQLLGNAPARLSTTHDAVLELLKTPLTQTRAAEAYFLLAQLLYNAPSQELLGRPLTPEERGDVTAAHRTLGLHVFRGEPPEAAIDQLRTAVARLQEEVTAPGAAHIDPRLIPLLERINAFTGRAPGTPSTPENMRELRILTSFVARHGARNARSQGVKDVQKALMACAASDRRVTFTAEERPRINALSERLHTAQTGRSGRVYALFHDLRRELLHPESGLLPGITRDYLQEVGREAITTIQALDDLTEGTPSLATFRAARDQLRNFFRQFELIMRRECTHEEREHCVILDEILHHVIETNNPQYLQGNLERFIAARTALRDTVHTAQGLLQRQITSLTGQVHGMLGQVTRQVESLTATLPQQNPLMRLQEAFTRFRTTYETQDGPSFAADRETLLAQLDGFGRMSERDQEAVFGRPVAECTPSMAQLERLRNLLRDRLHALPADDATFRETRAFLGESEQGLLEALRTHPQYGPLQAAVDNFAGMAEARLRGVGETARRTLAGFGLGGAPAAGVPVVAPEAHPAAPARTPREHPSNQCYRAAQRILSSATIEDEAKSARLLEELRRFDAPVAARTTAIIAERQGMSPAVAQTHLHDNHPLFFTAFARALAEKIGREPHDVQRLFCLYIYEHAPDAPACETMTQKIAWAQAHIIDAPEHTVAAFAHASTPIERAEARELPQAPPHVEGERAPADADAGNIGAVCGGLFSGALHFLQNAPQVMSDFSVKAFGDFVKHHLTNTVIPFVQGFRDLDAAQRAEIIQTVEQGVAQLEAAQRDASPVTAYQTALRDVARSLSRYDLLINGTSIVPSFGEAYTPDGLSEVEAERIAAAERVQNERDDADRGPPAQRVNVAKQEFTDLAGMWSTFMYVVGTRAGEENRAQVLMDEIDRKTRSGELIPGSEEHTALMEELRGARGDNTLEQIMFDVRQADPADRVSVFKTHLNRHIDRRTDISWGFKVWLKWVTVPLCMTFIPYFVGRTIDKALWTVRLLIQDATTQSAEGVPVAVINTKIIKELTNFLERYGKALDIWAENGGEVRGDAVERYMYSKEANKGWDADEIYALLGDELVEKFFADASISEAPGRWTGDALNFATTPPFDTTFVGILGNCVVWPFKFTLGLLGTIGAGVLYAGASVGQAVWNAGSKYVMQKVVLNAGLIEQVSGTATDSLYGQAYMQTMNRILMAQLREASKLLIDVEKDSATEKGLGVVIRLVENPSLSRGEAFSILERAWKHVKTKGISAEREEALEAQYQHLKAHLAEDGAPQGMAVEEYNRLLKELCEDLWVLHTENRSEGLGDKYPEATKQAVAALMEAAVVTLDKRANTSPHRAGSGGIIQTLRDEGRNMFLNQAADSLSTLLLVGCQTLFEENFLHRQLATALEASNETMLFANPTEGIQRGPDGALDTRGMTPQQQQEAQDRALAAHQTEQQVAHYLEQILHSAVGTAIDGAAGSMRDGKLQMAKEMIDWYKITFTPGVGLRCKAPTLQKNVTAQWRELLQAFEADEGNTELLETMHTGLTNMLHALAQKRRDLSSNDNLSEQMKRHIGEAREGIVRSLHRLQDHLGPLKTRFEARTASRTNQNHVTFVEQACERGIEQLEGMDPQTLHETTDDDFELLDGQTQAIVTNRRAITAPDPQLQEHLTAADRSAEDAGAFIDRLKLHKEQMGSLRELEGLIGRYSDSRRAGMVREGRSVGVEAVVAPITGDSAQATALIAEIERKLVEIGDRIPADRERFRPLFQDLLRATSPEDVQDKRQAIMQAVDQAKTADKEEVARMKTALQQRFEQVRDGMRAYSARLDDARAAEDALPTEQLIADIREDLEGIQETVDGVTYPPLLNVDVIDLSPGSSQSAWVKGFVLAELQSRARQALEFTRDESAFKGAIHYAAGALVREFADPAVVRRRNQTVRASA